jgi:hypothetical protein
MKDSQIKKWFMTIIAMSITASSFAQGYVAFKTSISHNPVYYSFDGTSAGLGLVGTDGYAAGYGPVNYEIYTAPNGTVLSTGPSGVPDFTGWTGTSVGSVSYTIPGVIAPTEVTLPASSGLPGTLVEMEVVAYTGSLSNPTLEGWSGETFAGGDTVTYSNITTSTGALGWSQFASDPTSYPPEPPAPLVAGASGLGSIVLEPVPDASSTLLLGGVSVIGLLLFRARKQFVC